MIFRDQLLDGRRIALAGGDDATILTELRRLGAWAEAMPDAVASDVDQARGWVEARTPLHGLVFDATGSFGSGGPSGLRDAMRLAWLTTRAVATGALIPAGRGESEEGGRLVLVTPRPQAGVHAEATGAALENLARTLSVEWARFSVTAVAICPGQHATGEQLTQLVCFLLSPAGGYYSGCRWELGA